jgi:serpin B
MIKRSGVLVAVMMVLFSVDAQTSKNVRPLNQFSFELYGELKKEHENVFFSPLSTYMSLAILSDGAAGTNKAEIDSVLGLSKKFTLENVRSGISTMMNAYLSDGTIRMANGCWVDESVELKKDFLNSFYSQSLSKVEQVNMSEPKKVVRSVNKWASDATAGTIPNLLTPAAITPLTRMLLCNSLYMDLPWESKFKAHPNYVLPFKTAAGDSIDLNYLFKEAYFEYAYDRKSHFLMKDLGEGDQAFCIIVPKEGSDLSEIEAQLTSKKFSQIRKRSYDQRVRLSLPKFTMSEEISFKNPLRKMGLNQAFMTKPDFSEMTDENLSVDDITQRVEIEVNEKRIVAAAVTVVRFGYGSAAGGPDPDVPIPVIADRPFLFLIIDKETNGIYFMGRYAVPSDSDRAKVVESVD